MTQAKPHQSVFQSLLQKIILDHPLPVVLLSLLICGGVGYFATEFKLDASAESLMLEDDEDLRYFRKASRQFPSQDTVIVAVEPKADIFSEETIRGIEALDQDLSELPNVAGVDSIVDAPLFHSPKISLLQLAMGYNTLSKPKTDRELARVELTESPMFSELMIDKEATVTAMQVRFQSDPLYSELADRRFELREKKAEGLITPEEQHELEKVEAEFNQRHDQLSQIRRKDVAAIREVLAQHRDLGKIYLGGLPIIVADMIGFVEHDLTVFGLGVLGFLFLTLTIIFRRAKWVVFPLIACMLTGVVMFGFLGLTGWRATVVSSNFASLLFIMTMSMTIHIAVRYQELRRANPDGSHRDWLFHATSQVAKPCFYCALTTMVGFASLLVSGIRPVIDFGMMMTVGLAVAYAVCFICLPAMLALVPAGNPPAEKLTNLSPTTIFANLTEKRGTLIAALATLIFVIGVVGILQLKVENRFIDYFKNGTDIRTGMLLIDKKLGGTTPLDIIIDSGQKNFWAKSKNQALLRKIHTDLASMEQSGKVLSLDTMLQIAEGINGGKPLGDFLFNMLRRAAPQDIKDSVLDPFVTEDFSAIKIMLRVRDSDPTLERDAYIRQIRNYFDTAETGIPPEQVRITGVLVLYNNMLQSLFHSQILTLGMVLIAIWAMFFILFRSFKLALIGILPNLLPVVMVLGGMGLAGIPLDLMTIMIAAVTMGIAVDQTIHYIHRFRQEFEKDGNYRATMQRCHQSIGKAMYYTSITIIVGFSILGASSFIPTIYFGLFTGFAMLVAMLAALTLLPHLLVVLKPLGPERHS